MMKTLGTRLIDDDDDIFEGYVDNAIMGPDLEDIDMVELDESWVVGEYVGDVGNGNRDTGEDRGKRPMVEDKVEDESGSETEIELEKDVLDEGDDFDECRLSKDDIEDSNDPVFNPQTTINHVFALSQIFASKERV
ncbi:hypothetical protein ACS0TY_017431 [Phlomoides rotata]